jgi:hypothetical protein
MYRNISFVRAKYPQAECSIKGGTCEMPALDHAVATNERWVILSDSCPEALCLGEGSTIQTAWENAAKKIRLTLSRTIAGTSN